MRALWEPVQPAIALAMHDRVISYAMPSRPLDSTAASGRVALPMDVHPNRPREHALRKGRWSEPGRIYLLTFVTDARRPLFTRWEPAAAASAVIGAPNTWGDATLLAWVLMPDHCHALVELGPIKSLQELVATAKSRSVRALRAINVDGPRIWQRGFHDHALRSDGELLEVARYVVANPLRAGLVRRLGDYPYWNAVWLDGGLRSRGQPGDDFAG
jgi:REP element-mobilizing transposase RayT